MELTPPLFNRERGEGERRKAACHLFFAAALPALLLYTVTLAPTVTAEDSGELITAAYTLGIAHPPGYPLWCILGKMFTYLPLGAVAWRVNLLSAALGAAAVGLLALIAFRFTRRSGISLTAALVFAASRDFWSQSVVAEVYTLNVLLVLLIVFLLFKFEDTRRTRWLYVAAFTVGLGLTNHSTMGPLAPLFFGWVFLREPRLVLRKLLLVNLLAAFLLGFSIILYLPIRSAADPVMDWGDPETLSLSWDHLLRRQYVEEGEEVPRTRARQVTLVLQFLKTYSAQFTPAVAALSLLGAARCFLRRRAAFFLLAPLFALTSYGFIWLLNYPPDRENLHLTRVFFLPAHAVGAIWLAMGIGIFAPRVSELSRLGFPRTVKTALGALAAVLVLSPLSAHFERNDHSEDYLAYDWGRNILQSLKPNAILLPSADHSTFPVLYLQTAEGLRPDVLNGNKYGYIEDRFFTEVFRDRDPPRRRPPLEGTTAEKERFLIEQSGRPVYLTTKAHLPDLRGYRLETYGLVFEAVKTSDYEPKEEEHRKVWASMTFHAGSLSRKPGEYGNDLILADYYYARGRRELLFDHTEEAVKDFRRAARHGEDIKAIYNNLGGALAESDKYKEALPFLKRALALDPDYEVAIRNIANCYYALEAYREGVWYFFRALEYDPGNLALQLAKARGYKAGGKDDLARFSYQSLLFVDRHNEEVWKEYEEFMVETFGREEFEGFRAMLGSSPKVAQRKPRRSEPPEPPRPEPGPPSPRLPQGGRRAARPEPSAGDMSSGRIAGTGLEGASRR